MLSPGVQASDGPHPMMLWRQGLRGDGASPSAVGRRKGGRHAQRKWNTRLVREQALSRRSLARKVRAKSVP